MALKVYVPLINDIRNCGESGGTTSGSPAYSPTGGRFGGKYTFNSSPITFSETTNLNINSGCTVAVWVYLTSNGTCDIYSNASGGPVNFTFGISAQKAYINHYNNSWLSTTDTTTIPLNTWTHVVWVCKQNNVYFYINGIERTNGDASVGSGVNIPMNILGSRYGQGNKFQGALSDFRVYNEILSNQDIHELSLSKVAHWPLNEDPVNKYNLPTLDYGGAKWACLLVHNNPANNLFANDSAGGCYGKYGDNLYSRLHLLTGNSFKTSGGVIEFLVIQKAESSNGDSYYRWTQTVNPIDTGTSSSSCTSANIGFTNVSNAPYGLCRRSNYSYFTGTGQGSSWWGAIGCYTAYSGGIPGFASVIVKSGYLKLYVRIDNLPKEKCYDISGNHNDLTCNGVNIISYSDTKRYDKSIRLQAQNVNTGYLQTNTGISAITNGSVSFWAKVINKGNSGWLPFTGQSGSYYIMAWNNGGNFYHQTIGDNTKIIYCDGQVTATFPNDTNWHYYVMTGINLSSWTTFKINNYGNSWNSDVAYSDVRLYTSVLSADDVQKLYKLGNV